jgi:DNA-binding HxlR family transcriptional regulator
LGLSGLAAEQVLDEEDDEQPEDDVRERQPAAERNFGHGRSDHDRSLSRRGKGRIRGGAEISCGELPAGSGPERRRRLVFMRCIVARGRPLAQPVNLRMGWRKNRIATIRIAMRTMNPIHESTSCAVAACAEIIGAKWTALLVHDLSEGPRRFSELEHSCAGISPRTLSERLRALEDEGLVERRSYPESPPRVEYELTEKGEALLPIINEMREFGHAYLTA